MTNFIITNLFLLFASTIAAERDSLLELLSTLDSQARVQVKASGDRRRIWGNNHDPCEASGDSDATNNDCYALRWSMLNTYWPLHQTLRLADKNLVLSEWASEGILGSALGQLDEDADMVAGNDGTLASPSVTNGLIYETNLLANATAQLQRASIASVDALFASLLNVTQVAMNDTSGLKNNIAGAYASLMAQVHSVAAAQAARASNNTATMVGDANSAMSQAVGSVSASQTKLVGVVGTGVAVNKAGSTGFATNQTKLVASLNDAQDFINSTSDGMQSTAQSAGTTFSAAVQTAADAVGSAASDQASTIATQGGKLVDTFKTQTSGQISDAQAAWESTAGTVSDQGKAQVAAASDSVDSFGANVTNSVTLLQGNLTANIANTTSNLQAKTNDATQSNQDVSTGATQIASTVAAGSDAAKSTAAATATSAQSTAGENQQQLQALILTTSQTSGQSVSSIIAALGGAQSDAQSGAQQTAAQQQTAIDQFLAQIGSDNTKVAGVMGNLQSMVASGTSSAQAAINSAISGAQGTSASTGTQLTGQLDAASSTLSQTEQQFASGASATATSLKNQIASGSATTGTAVASFQQNTGAIGNALQTNMLSAMSGFEGNADDVKNSLGDLLQTLQSQSAQGDNTKTATQSVSDQSDDAMADALFGVSTSDDDVANNIAAEVKAQQTTLNQAGAAMVGQSSTDVQKLWAQISTQLAAKSGQNDQVTSQAEATETSAMNTAGSISAQASALAASTDSLAADQASKSQLALSDFTSQLNQMGAKDGTMVTNMQTTLNGYTNDAMGDVSGYLTALLATKSSAIAQNITSQNNLLQTLSTQSTSTGAAAQKMNAIVAALQNNANDDRDALIGGVLNMLDTIDKATHSFSVQISDVQDNFSNVKASSAAGLSSLLSSVQTEVLKIPEILTSGAAQMQNEFALASSDLEDNILKLKEKLATAQTDEEKEEALQGLIVLNKMQAIQQGVQDADTQLRAQIASGAQSGQITSANVQGAMTGVLAAMTSINSQMDTSRVTVQSNVQMVGKQTATLVNGLGLLVNQTADQLSNDAASAAVSSRFDLNMAQARSKVRAAAATQGVNRTMTTFSANTNSAINHEAEVQGNIGDLGSTAKSASSALGARIDAVLNDVLSGSGQIQSDASVNESDVLTRLALVRMAMANFLGLWNEYAMTMDRKFKRFHSTDSEFIAQMERDIRTKLSGSEQTVNATVTTLGGLKKDIELSMQEEIEFENLFNSKIAETRETLKELNTEREENTIQSGDTLSDFANFETENSANLKETIKSLIEKFDAAVSDRLNQASETPEISS